MRTLGVSFGYHDATAALVAGDRLWMASEERYSRLKHDPNLPRRSIAACLGAAGMTAGELDAVVYYEEPHAKFARVLVSTLAAFPWSAGRFAKSARDWVGERLWSVEQLAIALDLPASRVQTAAHHQSHAAQAFLGSPFSEAAILTLDAVGEWTCTSIARGHADGRVEVLASWDYPHSLGLFYAAFTGFLGFRPNDGECSTMALARFGQPTRADDVRRVLQVSPAGDYALADGFLDLTAETVPYTRRFLDLFGEPRDPRRPLPFDALGDETAPPDARRWADLAASVQLVLEEAVLALARRAKRETGLDRLCLAGGVALNCVANARLCREGPFTEIYIPPDPGDGGAAFGAAMTGHKSRVAYTPFCGPTVDTGPALDLLPHLDVHEWTGGTRGDEVRLHVERPAHPETLVARVVERLGQGEVVGWFQGGMESGPRALGQRSILFDPRRVDLARRVSTEVKARAPFRPYALSVAEDDAAELLEGASPLRGWMQVAAPVRDPARVRAGVHIDGTTRPQVCRRDENPLYHDLLRAWVAESGAPALLNTSMNGRGHPIVDGPFEALAFFARSRLDCLVLGDTILHKTPPTGAPHG